MSEPARGGHRPPGRERASLRPPLSALQGTRSGRASLRNKVHPAPRATLTEQRTWRPSRRTLKDQHASPVPVSGTTIFTKRNEL